MKICQLKKIGWLDIWNRKQKHLAHVHFILELIAINHCTDKILKQFIEAFRKKCVS